MSFEAYGIQKCWLQIYEMLDSNWLLQPSVSPWILSSIILASCSILPLPFPPIILYLTKHWISQRLACQQRTKFPILLLCLSWRWNRERKTLLIFKSVSNFFSGFLESLFFFFFGWVFHHLNRLSMHPLRCPSEWDELRGTRWVGLWLESGVSG